MRWKAYSQTEKGDEMNATLTGNNDIAFYLGAKDQPFLRVRMAKEVCHHYDRHLYGHKTPFPQGDTFDGIVVSLSHGRYLAGWTMGKGMYSVVERYIFNDKEDAASMANEGARIAAERSMEEFEKDQIEQRILLGIDEGTDD